MLTVLCWLLYTQWAHLWFWTDLSCCFPYQLKIYMDVKVAEASWPTFMFSTYCSIIELHLIDFYKIPFSVGASGSFSILIVCGLLYCYNKVEVESKLLLRVHSSHPFSFFILQTNIRQNWLDFRNHLMLRWSVTTYWFGAFLNYLFHDFLSKVKKAKTYLPKVIRTKTTNFSF